MKTKYPLPLTILVAALPAYAVSTLEEGHTDIGVAYELGAFDLHIHDEVNDVEYAPDEALLQVNPAAYELIPNNANYGFLGTIGFDHVWRLPKNQVPGLLFLGVGAEEIESGTLDGDQFTFSLVSVTNSLGGKFTMYDVDGFNVPSVVFNSGDGITAADSVVLPSGVHSHFNWTFSQPGEYAIDFKVDALVDGVPQTATATYTFNVVPEPSSAAFGLLGGMAILTRRRRS